MATFRQSTAVSANERLTACDARPGSLEAAARSLAGEESIDGTLLLVGGCDLAHFRLRVAQSHIRSDMAPSFWSHVGILCEDASGIGLYEVALDPAGGFQNVPKTNAVQRASADRYDDAERYPNVALLRFPALPEAGRQESDVGDEIKVTDAIERIRSERGLLDLPGLVLPWLGYVWGAGSPVNPLLGGTGFPCAVFAEAAFASLRIELTPGLSTHSTCPEAIWQTARWWHPYFAAERDAGDGRQPTGVYWIEQKAASYKE